MHKWMKKLHMYAGLLSFLAFLVWGVAGIVATLAPAPGNRKPPEPSVRYVDFPVQADLGDEEVAERMLAKLDPPFVRNARPQRDDQGRLFLNYFTPNGRRLFVLDEPQNRIEVREFPMPFLAFVNTMHVQTWNHSHPATEVKLWGAYNEFSLWAMLFMSISGVYLWLATRPNMRWAQWTAGAATLLFVALYFSLR